ncbi:hypothetical protein FKR81_00045 [Lentzea tibetensis]|uniref:Uncharacterized protein n=1 Tax=Lentzea tibetensis TaxID=2591470 RepID=A0A563F3S2_9PSEU|nr:hypothetical protein [Lentzea tibetensis]TWP54004.1 hypothetical protein FKR81_00045 [Lentzea tibetensis]
MITKGRRMVGLSAVEVADQYGRFLEDRGFVVLRKNGGLKFTVESADGVRSVVVVAPCCLTGVELDELEVPGTTVVFSGPVGRALVHRLTMADVPVVWWNGSIWNGSGSAYAAGMTSM